MVELFINGTDTAVGQVTLYGDEPLSLNISMSDIKDIAKRNSTYSEQFVVPADKNNNILFNHIFNIGADSSFDTRRKTPCYILNDGVLVFSGNLQLTDIGGLQSNPTDYKVTVYGEVIDLVKTLGDKLLTDLDFDELSHNKTVANIEGSWSASTVDLGYFYPLVDYGYDFVINDMISATGLNGNLLHPAISNTYTIKKIFNNIGFRIDSDFLFNDIEFKDSIIPFSGDRKSVEQGHLEGFKSYLTDATFFAPNPSGAVTYQRSKLPFTNTTTNGGHNYSNNFNTSPSTAPFQYNGYYVYTSSSTQSQYFTLELSYNYNSGSQNRPDTFEVRFYRSSLYSGNGGFYSYEKKVITNTNSYQFVKFDSPILSGTTASQTYAPRVGEVFWVDVVYENSKACYQIFDTKTCFYSNFLDSTNNIVQGVDMNKYIPQKIKQVDYIKSIITMFNLMVIPDKNDPKLLKLIPRNDYFKNGEVKDWTNKLDDTDKNNRKIVSETQNKSTKFSYKSDVDYYNVNFFNKYNKVFGEYVEYNDNEWVEGENKIEVIFSPTPGDKVLGSSDIYLPKIAKRDEKTGVYGSTNANIRFLNKKIISTIHNFKIRGGTSRNSYPYCGHLDHPTASQLDYNFGAIEWSYYSDLYNLTPNNLVNNYWREYLDDIKDKNSSFITCKMYLTPDDINKFNYNDNIYIEGLTDDGGHYFIVNSINYIPTSNLPSTVELIKINRNLSNYVKVEKEAFVMRGSNRLAPISSFEIGSENIIESPDTLVIGTNNTTSPYVKNVFIQGENNFIDAPDVTVIGDNNIILSEAKGSTIIGSNITAQDPGTTYIGGNIVKVVDVISASVDEILSPFSENMVITNISASRDCIREPGSYDNIMVISGGRY